MRYTRYEIRKRLDVAADPCALFELINRYPVSTDFRFELSLANDTRTIRVSTTPRERLSVHPDNVLDGRIAELFDSDDWTVRVGHKTYTLDSAYQQIDPPLEDATDVSWQGSEHEVEDFGIEINGFMQRKGPEGIPARLQNDQVVVDEIFRRTWIGGLKYLATGSALEWTLLGRSLTISTLDRRNALDVKEMSPTVEVRAGSVTFYLTVSALPSRQKQRTVRIAGQGEVTYREWLDPVANALEDSPHHFCEWICEIDCPELVLGNELVRKISAARRKDVGNIASKLMQDGTILSTARVLSQNHLEHRAKQLETRIRASKRAEQAVYNSEILMDVPIAETGTVALFHILEGRRGLPFESFRTRSWTPKVGIDAIADFRLAPGELPLSHVPVEFEYGFDTYITHKHEPEHTDLIVCWTVGDGTRRNPRLTRHRLGRSWLWNYRSEAGIDIPVAEMRKFPGLTVKRIGPDDD